MTTVTRYTAYTTFDFDSPLDPAAARQAVSDIMANMVANGFGAGAQNQVAPDSMHIEVNTHVENPGLGAPVPEDSTDNPANGGTSDNPS